MKISITESTNLVSISSHGSTLFEQLHKQLLTVALPLKSDNECFCGDGQMYAVHKLPDGTIVQSIYDLKYDKGGELCDDGSNWCDWDFPVEFFVLTGEDASIYEG